MHIEANQRTSWKLPNEKTNDSRKLRQLWYMIYFKTNGEVILTWSLRQRISPQTEKLRRRHQSILTGEPELWPYYPDPMILILLLHLYRCHLLLYLPLYRLHINLILAPTHHLHIGNRGVLFAIKYRINFFHGFALCLHPIVPLLILAMNQIFGTRTLTMRPKITISHEALTMYIFQPMLLSPIGMMNTNTSLQTSVIVAQCSRR